MENTKPSTPFFVLGVPRSGTTLVQLILDSHSEIAVCPETYLFGILDRTHSNQTIDKEWQYFEIIRTLEQRLAGFNDLAVDLVEELKNSKSPYTGSTDAFLRQIQASYLARKNKRICGEKTPEHIHFLAGLRGICPEAKIIFVIRNPFSVIQSLFKSQRLSPAVSGYSRSTLIRRSALMVRQGWEDRESFLHQSTENTYTIQYEKLTTSPQEEIRRLCQFLEVPFEEGMLAFHKRDESFIVEGHSSKAKIHAKLSQNIQQNTKSPSDLGFSSDEQLWLKSFLAPCLKGSPYQDLQVAESLRWNWRVLLQLIFATIRYRFKIFRWREWILKARNYIRLKLRR